MIEDPHYYVWTFKNLVRQLKKIGVKRAVIGDHECNPFCVVFSVAPRHHDLLARFLADSQPMFYSFTVRKLPWWRCWFHPFQLKEPKCDICGFHFSWCHHRKGTLK